MLLVFSVLLMCIGHIIRVRRWRQFICIYEKADTRNLVQSLSIGYLLNFLVPFKLGDLFRICMAGRKMKNGFGFAAATVVVDRYLDVIVVGIIFIVLKSVGLETDSPDTIVFYSSFSLAALTATILLWHFRKYVKKLLKIVTSVFNYKIEFKILKFCFSLISSFKDIKKVKKGELLLNTAGMWIMYLLSYFCFSGFLFRLGRFIETADIFYLLFEKDSLMNGNFGISGIYGSAEQSIWFIIFLLSPVIILFAGSFVPYMQDREQDDEDDYLNLIPYVNEKEKLDFLELYFESERSSYVQRYLKVNRNILIINDFSAGSNATTMLCMDNGKSFFRKYAFDVDGEKLYKQIEWLQKFQSVIPCTKILRYEKEEGFCYYDMAYDSRVVGLFQYAHSMPKESAWKIIRKAMECLEESLYCINRRPADTDTVNRYIEDKVVGNLGKIMDAKYFRRLMEYEEVVINGRKFKNLPGYLSGLEKKHLFEIFKDDNYSEIHGDLTIENIICIRDSDKEDDFYMIDPNTGNIHDSPNLDYAKLLQSLHGGYEFLMAAKNVEVSQNRINFIFTKSEIYTYLSNMLDSYLMEKFSRETVRSIYYHEIIHWLRLIPYKIEKNGKRALLFYAGMLMVMSDVECRFGGGQYKRQISNF